ncbi:MAG: LLM class flavin-dependent oxidoreductase [Nitrososphaeraceae archaeon]|jgi:alkanesulfonate monooxygenase SsuD/methylene tetrahydromethanopterin reductase-like flavin-dependent oxidoreductase (luciferase family)
MNQMKQTIGFGLHLPIIRFKGEADHSREQILSFAKKAEYLDYDYLGVNDHIVFRSTSWLDALTTLTAAAAITNKIKVGTSILNIVVRNPVVCAKALTGIDILSSGRLFAGVGPGSYKGDYDVCGIAFEDRWKRFDESLQILNLLWKREKAENKVNYNGNYYKFEKVVVTPRTFQRPHPPILIGSWGSSRPGLRRVAKYGDGWMASAYNITPDKFKEKWKMLLSYRKDMGRDTTRFTNYLVSMFGYIDNNNENIHKMVKDILSPALGRPADELERLLLFGSVNECIKKVKAFLEAGVNSVHFWPVNNYIEQIEIFSKEIISSFR